MSNEKIRAANEAFFTFWAFIIGFFVVVSAGVLFFLGTTWTAWWIWHPLGFIVGIGEGLALVWAMTYFITNDI